ncbi:diaminopimelate epimerase [Bacillus methanolicus]|uniref:Diaminopimelate epimerase n=1 Tax=Bacillus methanolicus (strain MGA3 / ATCC 53907) TaxID=796606 RepID=I3E9F4_BACMM|nr:diaminopimelate epimerase [Bacillus methanolicus]AIE60374.1 Diaminopimelate epimerase [Bacillus methanolicus MGA3]EIJ83125.1 diaminopimelate epimerase [Bacillus methanolicus MGA3]
MKIEILKVHGSGNDFLLIDEISNDYSFSEEERSKLAVALCDRNTDLGSDGILYVQKGDNADARMRIFNADGSEASMCGNGLRCVARYVCELYGKEEALINTMKTDLPVKKQKNLFPNVPTYQVEISPVSFQLSDLPLVLDQTTLLNEKIPALSKELVFTALAVPNPHLVSIVEKDQIHSQLQKQISEYVNGPNELFPDGVNVSFVMPLEKGQIYVRTFERGVGFTNACGTAMSASSLVTCLNDINSVEEPIEVYNNGGKVRCVVHHQNGAYTIDLIGNATYVYKAEVNLDVNEPESFRIGKKEEFSDEQLQYAKLVDHVQEHLSKFL